MTDRNTRRQILEYLRGMYEQDVEFPTADDELATALGIDHNVARATLKYLSEKNLIDLDDSKFTWYCMINVNGIDELEKFESEDRNQARNTDSEPAKLPTVFISHSIHDIDLAKHIKSWLEVVGISVFIAHQDLQPAKNFDVEIIEQIKSSLIFIPLLTKKFRNSEWCDQEAGIAIATKSIILPIKIENDPHGFMDKKNALRWNDDMTSIIKLSQTVVGNLPNEELKRIRYELLKKDGLFSTCSSYDEAGLLSFIISDFPDLTSMEVISVTESLIKNDQINGSRTAHRHLESILDKNIDKIPKKLLTHDVISSYLR